MPLFKFYNYRFNLTFQLHSELVHLDPSSLHVASLSELMNFLSKLLFDPNFKITLTAIQIIDVVVSKAKKTIENCLKNFLPALAEKFGDSKIIIRQTTKDLVLKLIDILTPTPIFGILLSTECFESSSKHLSSIREEIIQILIRSLLVYSGHEFDYQLIAKALMKALLDPKQKVQFFATEGLTLLHTEIPSKLMPFLIRNLEVKTSNALMERFKQGKPPTLAEDGSLQFHVSNSASENSDSELTVLSLSR